MSKTLSSMLQPNPGMDILDAALSFGNVVNKSREYERKEQLQAEERRRYEEDKALKAQHYAEEIAFRDRKYADENKRAQQRLALEQGRYAMSKQAHNFNMGNMRLEREEKEGLKKDYDYLASKLRDGQDLSALDGDPILMTGRGYRAAVMLSQDRANMGQNNLQTAQRANALAQETYINRFRPLMFQATKAYEAGDMNAFAQYATAASNVAPMPYKVQAGQDGNFQEMFRSSEDGGFVASGKSYSPKQVYELLRSMGASEQMVLQGANMQAVPMNVIFNAAGSRYMAATDADNKENILNPSKRYILNNGTHYAVAQNKLDDYSQSPDFMVYDAKSDKLVATAKGAQGLQENGFKVTGRGVAQQGLYNKNGQLSIEPGSQLGNLLAQSGYVYSKDTKWWYDGVRDVDGKLQPGTPLSQKAVEEVVLKHTGGAMQARPKSNGGAETQQAPPAPQQKTGIHAVLDGNGMVSGAAQQQNTRVQNQKRPSILANINGREYDVPLFVPTLTAEEENIILAGSPPTEAIIAKAVKYATERIANGSSPWPIAEESFTKLRTR